MNTALEVETPWKPAWPSTSPPSTAMTWWRDSFRIRDGYGFSKQYEIERLHREAPILLIGEGTSDIQKMIIGRRILEDYRLGACGGRAVGRDGPPVCSDAR